MAEGDPEPSAVGEHDPVAVGESPHLHPGQKQLVRGPHGFGGIQPPAERSEHGGIGLVEVCPRPRHMLAEQRPESFPEPSLENITFADSVPVHRLERQVDPSPGRIGGDIPRDVDQLEPRAEMEGAYQLDVPLDVDVGVAASWADA